MWSRAEGSNIKNPAEAVALPERRVRESVEQIVHGGGGGGPADPDLKLRQVSTFGDPGARPLRHRYPTRAVSTASTARPRLSARPATLSQRKYLRAKSLWYSYGGR